MGRGIAWLDTGTPESLISASNFVYSVEKLQGFKIACLEEIALNNNWISKNFLKKILKKQNYKTSYYDYIRKIINKNN